MTARPSAEGECVACRQDGPHEVVFEDVHSEFHRVKMTFDAHHALLAAKDAEIGELRGLVHTAKYVIDGAVNGVNCHEERWYSARDSWFRVYLEQARRALAKKADPDPGPGEGEGR